MNPFMLKLTTVAAAFLLAACPAGSSAAPKAAKVVVEYTLGTGETGKNVVDWCVAAKPCRVGISELPAATKKRGIKTADRLRFFFHMDLALNHAEKQFAKLDRDDYVIIRWDKGAGWQVTGDWPKRGDTKPTPPGSHVYEPDRDRYFYWSWKNLTEAPLELSLVNKTTKETAKITLTFSAVEPAKGS